MRDRIESIGEPASALPFARSTRMRARRQRLQSSSQVMDMLHGLVCQFEAIDPARLGGDA